jgi:predicted RecA/RadA family phage recombinase
MPSTPKAQFIHDGDSIDYTPTSDVKSGDVIVLNPGTMLGIAKLDIASHTKGALATVGVFDMVKNTGPGTAIPLGMAVTWDRVNFRVSTSTGANYVPLGHAIAFASDDAATVRVRLAL